MRQPSQSALETVPYWCVLLSPWPSPTVSSAGVLAPSSLALPVPDTKQKPLSLDTGSPQQARTVLAFPGGPVCSLMASAKAPPNPTPSSNRCALGELTLLWVQPGPLISPLGQSIVHTQTASADTVILPFVFLLHAVAFKCQIAIRSLPLWSTCFLGHCVTHLTLFPCTIRVKNAYPCFKRYFYVFENFLKMSLTPLFLHLRHSHVIFLNDWYFGFTKSCLIYVQSF